MQADAVLKGFEVRPNLFLLGSLETGLTIFSQQVRAHNLIWALKKSGRAVNSIAVIGAGIAGLTAVACALSVFRDAKVTLFESALDICPLQQGCDTRWLHPRIYNWPDLGSRAPEASLPVLNWSEGRASDVAREILQQFTAYHRAYARDRFELYLGVKLKVDSDMNEIQWRGGAASGLAPFFRVTHAKSALQKFDLIVLACGFGVEHQSSFSTPSYWKNEQLAQPMLDGGNHRFLVSGLGDGALVDLCRLTIERFRQDAILYELFGDLEKFEEDMRSASVGAGNLFDVLEGSMAPALEEPCSRLCARRRKDTTVYLQASGSHGAIQEFRDIFTFTQRSSRLNKLLLYLLHKCDAFTVSYEPLPAAVKKFGIAANNVICRHGTSVLSHIEQVFVEPQKVHQRLNLMKTNQAQSARSLWKPGTFPVLT